MLESPWNCVIVIVQSNKDMTIGQESLSEAAASVTVLLFLFFVLNYRHVFQHLCINQ